MSKFSIATLKENCCKYAVSDFTFASSPNCLFDSFFLFLIYEPHNNFQVQNRGGIGGAETATWREYFFEVAHRTRVLRRSLPFQLSSSTLTYHLFTSLITKRTHTRMFTQQNFIYLFLDQSIEWFKKNKTIRKT